jgi:polar amino acid transport system substrate-binding protein
MTKHPFHPSHFAWLAATAAVLFYGGTAAAANLSVCIDKSSPTAAMDTSLARAVARQEGATLAVHSFDGSGDDEGFSLKEFNKLAKDSCSLILGFPLDADSQGLPAGLLSTTPYGHTGFVLVTPKSSPATTLDQLPKDSDVAVTYETTPNLYFVDHPNVNADVRLSDADALKALETHAVRAAMLWQPTVVRFLSDRHEAARYRFHELHEAHAQFNLVGLYDSDHMVQAKAFEQAIDTLASSGKLTKLLAPYAESGTALPTRRAATAQLGRADRQARVGRRCAGSVKRPRAARAGKSKSDKVPALFTAAQADSGKQKFMDHCQQCHGPTLEGRAGPALKGPNFASPDAKFHVGDIFTIVSQNMPASEPGTLAHDDYVQIMAFLLQQNGYPAGTTPLTFEAAGKSKVKLLYRGN